MKGTFDVVVVGKGSYGPFKDDEFPDDRSKDRHYQWVSMSGADGEGEPIKATYAPGLVFDPPLFKAIRVEIELRDKGKIRLLGEAPPAAKLAAA